MAIDLNNAPPQNETPVTVYHDVEAIAGALAQCADRWVPELFPQGRIVAGELRLANIRGAAPRKQGSCVVQLTGDHAGSWYEHETKQGGGPLSTLKEALRLSGEALLRHAVGLIEQHGATSYLARGSASHGPASHGPAARPAVDRNASEIAINLANMVPLVGTLGETYLHARGLAGLPDTVDLGFYSNCTHWATRSAVPALIARFRYPDGKPSGGIHRIYLLPDGSWHTGDKLMLGPVDGAVVMLGRVDPVAGVLGIGEGIESTLGASEIFGVPGWACASDGGMRKFAAWLRLNIGMIPIRRLLVWGDAKRAGAAAAGELFATAREFGIPAELYMPRSGDDFAADLQQGLRLVPGGGNGHNGSPPPGWAGPQAEPEILPPGAASAEMVIEMAGRLTKQYTPSEVTHIVMLLGQGGFPPIVEEKVFSLIRQRTGLPVATIKRELRKIKPGGSGGAGGSGSAPTWAADIIRTLEGEPVPIEKNVLIALQGDPAWQGVVGLDDFHQRAMLMRPPPWDTEGTYPRPFNDVDEVRALVWVQEQGIHVRTVGIVRNALGIIAEENRFHPVRDYLDSLVWDGHSRINKWLTYYLSVDPIENYTAPVGACWLISAVARIYQPGCTAKYVLILEGNQDLKKSTALEILGGAWFTDDMSELGTKDSAMQIGNAWIVELSELDSVRKAHLSAIKSFISRKVDRFRKPYGRNIIEQPRQCVLAGTINPSSPYILDETGGVRFWPVLCTSIDTDALEHDRDQLWAEAVACYHSGAHWYLDDDNKVQAAYKQQELRLSVDSWELNIKKYLYRDKYSVLKNQLTGETINEITVSDILEWVFDIPKRDHDRSSQTRVGIIMRRIGHQIGWRLDKSSHQRPRPYIRVISNEDC